MENDVPGSVEKNDDAVSGFNCLAREEGSPNWLGSVTPPVGGMCSGFMGACVGSWVVLEGDGC